MKVSLISFALIKILHLRSRLVSSPFLQTNNAGKEIPVYLTKESLGKRIRETSYTDPGNKAHGKLMKRRSFSRFHFIRSSLHLTKRRKEYLFYNF